MQNLQFQIGYYADWVTAFNEGQKPLEANSGTAFRSDVAHIVVIQRINAVINQIIQNSRELELENMERIAKQVGQEKRKAASSDVTQRTVKQVLEGVDGEQAVLQPYKKSSFFTSEVWERLFKGASLFIENSQEIRHKNRIKDLFNSYFFDCVRIDPVFCLTTLSSLSELSSRQQRVLESCLYYLASERNGNKDFVYYVASVLLEDYIVKKIIDLGGRFKNTQNYIWFDWTQESMLLQSPEAVDSVALLQCRQKKARWFDFEREFCRLRETLDVSDADAVRVYHLVGLYVLMQESQKIADMWGEVDPTKNRCIKVSSKKEERIKKGAVDQCLYGSSSMSLLLKKFHRFYSYRNNARDHFRSYNDGVKIYERTLNAVKELEICLKLYEEEFEEIEYLYKWGYSKYQECIQNGFMQNPPESVEKMADLPPPEAFCSIPLPSYPLDRINEVSCEAFMEVLLEEGESRYAKLMSLYIRDEHVREGLDRLGYRKRERSKRKETELPSDEVLKTYLPPIQKLKVVQPRKRPSKRQRQDNEVDFEEESVLPIEDVSWDEAVAEHKERLEKKELWSHVVAKNTDCVVEEYKPFPFRVHQRVSMCVEKAAFPLPKENGLYHSYPLCIPDLLVRYGWHGTWVKHSTPHYSCAGSIQREGEEPVLGCFTASFFKDFEQSAWVLYHHCFFPKSSGDLIEEYTEKGFYTAGQQVPVPQNEKLSNEAYFQKNTLRFTVRPHAIIIGDLTQNVKYHLSLPRGVRENWGFSLRKNG